MAGPAHTFLLSWVILASAVQAEQTCHEEECPATVNSLLQSGATAVQALTGNDAKNMRDESDENDAENMRDESDENDAENMRDESDETTPAGYTAHTGTDCKASNHGGVSVGQKTGFTISGVGTIDEAVANCTGFGSGCHGFTFGYFNGKNRFYLKKNFDMCKCDQVAHWTSYTKTSAHVATCPTPSPTPAPTPEYPKDGDCFGDDACGGHAGIDTTLQQCKDHCNSCGNDCNYYVFWTGVKPGGFNCYPKWGCNNHVTNSSAKIYKRVW